MKKNIAVVLAGGTGSRVGVSTPKQFLKVAGKMIVEHTVDAFEKNGRIDEIAIVSNPFYISDIENIVLRNNWKKVKKILKGGKERHDSTLSAVNAYKGSDVNLILHDAVRPLVSQRIINDVVSALETHHAVDVALPSADTVIEVDGDFISHIPDRSRLKRGQTPQAFWIETLAAAYEKSRLDPGFKATDDCGVVKKYLPETPIYVVAGEESNMKLTYKEDTYLLDKFFQLRRTATDDMTAEGRMLRDKTAVIFGGSYGIGAETAALLRQKGVKVHCFSRSGTHTDVGNREDVKTALQSVMRQDGRIDYVIATAGILHKEPLATASYENIVQAVNTNYFGTVNIAIEAFPYLKESKGMLIFFTSSSYTMGRAFYSIYSSTKAAIVNFVQAIAQEWESFGIRINCINPERTKTPMRIRNFGNEPDGTLLSASEVAEATIRTLASDYTGQIVDVKRKREA
ncbi:MAG: bifunctional cytidylyltransferase/SDR family oxidoreductase [Bacteroidales bacterium]|nr:bifunctional cytidylyltransferase/SDR family oxidoreductase [Bacteroidales bacterium]